MLDTENPNHISNSKIFLVRLAHFVELERTWAPAPRIDPNTGTPIPIGCKSSPTKYDIQFKPVLSITPPPFGELSSRLRAYDHFDRILKGGIKSTGEMRRQINCLDHFPLSEYSVDRLLFDCAEAVRFESSRTDNRKILDRFRKLQQRGALHKNTEEALTRAADMRRLAVAVNPGLTTAAAMLRPLENPVDATVQARNSAAVRKFGCLCLPRELQPRQEYPTSALLAFNLKWLFQHWPISSETGRPRRGSQPPTLEPPCYDLIADFVNAIFPESSQDGHFDAASIKDNLLKRIHPKASFCGW